MPTYSLVEIIKVFVIALPVFALIDYIWLAHLAKNFYLTSLAPLIRVENGSLVVNFGGAAVVYLVGVLAIILFVDPAHKTPGQALVTGALFGFVMYAFYDFTNYATLHNFPLKLALIDTLWGTFLFAIVSAITAWVLSVWK
jgi:uncharacterized membrane protein